MPDGAVREAEQEVRRLSATPSQAWQESAFDDFEAAWGQRFCRFRVVEAEIIPCHRDRLEAYKSHTKVVRAAQFWRALHLLQMHGGLPEGLDLFVSLEDAEVADWPVPVFAMGRTEHVSRVVLMPPLEILTSGHMAKAGHTVVASALPRWGWRRKRRRAFFRGQLSNSYPAARGGYAALRNVTPALHCRGECRTWQRCNLCADRMVPKTATNWMDFARGKAAALSKLLPHVLDARLSPCARSVAGACVGGCVKQNFLGDLCSVWGA